QAARLQMKSERRRALELLEEALGEARRIEADDPNRASLLIGVAIQFLNSDQTRAWEIMGEGVKAANGVEAFSGEDEGLILALGTATGLKFVEISGSEFSLARVVRLLAKEDLIRATELVKSFKYDAPRAVATLALASSVFEKSKAEADTRFQ